MIEILRGVQRSAGSIATVVGFLLLWQAIVTLFAVPTWLLPAPSVIWREFVSQSHLLGRHIVATGTGAVGGLAIGACSGLLLAILMVHSRMLQRILMPLLVIDQSIPKMALAPIFVIWFGTGMMTRVVIAMVISFFPIVVNAVRGMTTVDRRVNDLMMTISASRWDLLTKVQLPNAVPYIFSGLKVSVPLAIIGAVVAEFMQSDSGLGYIVLVAVGNVNTPMVFVAVLLMAFLSLSLFAAISLCEWVVFKRRFSYLAAENNA
ncbi:MAG TPA: ABC transporter permease [Nitrospira sp.]|nr:ABC transporter permease [Nitrospira sp.]